MCGQELTPPREEGSYGNHESADTRQDSYSRKTLRDDSRGVPNYGSYSDNNRATIDPKSTNSGAIYNFLKSNNGVQEEEEYPISNPPDDEFNFDEQYTEQEKVSGKEEYFATEVEINSDEKVEADPVVEADAAATYSSSIDRLRNKKDRHGKNNTGKANKDNKAESVEVKEDTKDNSKSEGKMQNSDKIQVNSVKAGSQKLIGWLVSFKKDKTGSAVEIREGRFFVGASRVRETDLVIADGSLSVPHCLMKADKESGIQVQDLMSENGTFIKKSGSSTFEKVIAPTIAEHGDWLKFGEYEVMVCVVPSEGRYI
jgi:hypothetical protein